MMRIMKLFVSEDNGRKMGGKRKPLSMLRRTEEILSDKVS